MEVEHSVSSDGTLTVQLYDRIFSTEIIAFNWASMETHGNSCASGLSALTAIFREYLPLDDDVGRSPAMGKVFEKYSDAEIAQFFIEHMPRGSADLAQQRFAGKASKDDTSLMPLVGHLTSLGAYSVTTSVAVSPSSNNTTLLDTDLDNASTDLLGHNNDPFRLDDLSDDDDVLSDDDDDDDSIAPAASSFFTASPDLPSASLDDAAPATLTLAPQHTLLVPKFEPVGNYNGFSFASAYAFDYQKLQPLCMTGTLRRNCQHVRNAAKREPYLLYTDKIAGMAHTDKHDMRGFIIGTFLLLRLSSSISLTTKKVRPTDLKPQQGGATRFQDSDVLATVAGKPIVKYEHFVALFELAEGILIM
jgi:hypothetical protein